MKKFGAVLLIIVLTASLLCCFAGCNQTLDIEDAWAEYAEAYNESLTYTQGKSYFVKYKYKIKDGNQDVTITQKLNVVYGNRYIDGWEDFITVDKGVEKAYLTRTDYTNSYYGFALKSGVKAKKATKDDYKQGFWRERIVEENGKKKKVYDRYELDQESYFALKAGDQVGDKQVTEDEEVYKYTLEYALSTLEGIDATKAEIMSASKRGIVLTINLKINDSDHVYGKYNSDSDYLIVQITKGRITKISNRDGKDFAYYLNYAGPKLDLPAYSE